MLQIPLLKQILLWLWKSRALVASVTFAALLVLYGYRWGAGNVQAEWDASAGRQRTMVQSEKDRLQKRADDIAADYAEYRRRQSTKMLTIRKELAYEI